MQNCGVCGFHITTLCKYNAIAYTMRRRCGMRRCPSTGNNDSVIVHGGCGVNVSGKWQISLITHLINNAHLGQ